MARIAQKEDFEFLKRAWKVCFDDPDEFIDWNFNNNFSFENTIVAEFDQELASCMQLMPHKVRLRENDYNINYVSGVATLPEYRKRGLVKEMYSLAFAEMKKRKQAFSLLVPFNYGFYEKFGYKQCYEKIFRYADIIPDLETVNEVSAELISRLNRIYIENMYDKNGYALRSQLDWQRILEDLLYISKGQVIFDKNGYALVTAKTDGGYEIHEMLGDVNLPCKMEKKPFAMARIIDPCKILKDMSREFGGCFSIKIRDEILPENNLILKIERNSVLPCDDWDFEVDIKDLAELIFGFCEDITKTGFFKKQNNYMNMIF